MILTIFIILVLIALILTISGFVIGEPVLTIIGTLFLFLIGLSLVGAPLQYEAGDNTSFVYGANLSNAWSEEGGDISASTDPYLFSTTTQKVYVEFEDSALYGKWLMILGALALCTALFML